jgi:hypothetical protein
VARSGAQYRKLTKKEREYNYKKRRAGMNNMRANNENKNKNRMQYAKRCQSTPPPTECRYCRQKGEQKFHWHSMCPNRPQKNQNTAQQQSTAFQATTEHTVQTTSRPNENLNSFGDQH